MRILAIDTATGCCGGAIADEKGILAQFSLNLGTMGKTHSQSLLPMVDALLKNAQIPLASLDALALTIGPGSFTGLRIGAATIKAWSQVFSLPIIAVSTLRAFAFAADKEGLVCPILDARRNQVYCGLYRQDQEIWPDMPLEAGQLAYALRNLGQKITFTGDALPVYQELFADILGDYFFVAGEDKRYIPAAACALLAVKDYALAKFTSCQDLLPIYLRASEAERKKMEAEEGKKPTISLLHNF
ncbi:MAG: tRNA (adenosine(37)-N6)-threonylcarbamoyltransferase complex dimerization subunit type 1 TsaB [Clostridiales bacterium]